MKEKRKEIKILHLQGLVIETKIDIENSPQISPNKFVQLTQTSLGFQFAGNKNNINFKYLLSFLFLCNGDKQELKNKIPIKSKFQTPEKQKLSIGSKH